jgi:hypothetical protein
MFVFDVISDIRGRKFEELLRELATDADRIGFVLQGGTSEDADALLNELEGAKVRDVLVQEWPGTWLSNGQARLLEYAMSDWVLQAMSNFACSLSDLSRQTRPEDLFIKSGSILRLESTAHERQATLRPQKVSPLIKSLVKDGFIIARA